MYRRILVAVDGSSAAAAALREALDPARDAHGRVRIVHVIDSGIPRASRRRAGRSRPSPSSSTLIPTRPTRSPSSLTARESLGSATSDPWPP